MTITAPAPTAVAVRPALMAAIADTVTSSVLAGPSGSVWATAATASEVEMGYAKALTALRSVSTVVADCRSVDDATLLALNASAAEQVTLAHTHQALIAGEVARRSAPELGSQGLAQRTGHRTPEQFIKNTTGASGKDAVTAVKAGRLLTEAADGGSIDQVTGEITPPARPWLTPVAEALTSGILSTAAAEAIGSGLGEPNSAISTEQLQHAAVGLVGQAVAGMPVDALFKEARLVRAELDVTGIKLAEAERYARRDLRLFDGADGAGRLVWDMDPETYVLAKQIFDRATSPKLGGVRFVDKTQKAKADQIEADPRTPGQLASDAFLQLLLLGADANPTAMLGSGAPVIRVTTTAITFTSGQGLVRMDGASDPVSAATLDRLRCEGQTLGVMFDSFGIPIDLGREQRLFNKNQREILAVKWGKCADPNCERPPSWCETHHIRHWKRDKGKTNIADGILLCKHHHMLYHNNGWEITRDDQGEYWQLKPVDIDPDQTPILLKQSRNMHDLIRQKVE
ncbi:MAG TPA: DUF222 domain-containing protein [Galbitalea sp.]